MKYNLLVDSLDDLMKEWNPEQEYVIFGASDKVDMLTDLLNNKLIIKYIVDNDQNKYETEKKGYKIMSPSILEQEKDALKIIIASDSFYEISQQLNRIGLKENSDYISYSKLLSMWKWYYENILCLSRTDIMVTSRCTLNCKYCNMFMPFYSKPKHQKLSDIQKDIDIYFNRVDYVGLFQIVGGEIFLHPNIYDILLYICSKYSHRIHKILIVTNGTIRPSSEVLSLVSNYNVIFSISDYTELVNYEDKLIEVCEVLDCYKIKYAVTKTDWVDFGSLKVNKNLTEDQLIKFFNNCRPPFRGLANGRLYYCHLNYSAVATGIFPDHINDYFDLSDTNDERNIMAINLLKFDMGYTDLGYITFCQNCNGCGGVNSHVVKSGEQLQRC